MADARNSGHLIGRLGADPEFKMTPAGVPLATFRLAFNDAYGEKTTHWVNGVAWRQAAEYLAEYCQKGNLIAITYHLKTESWEDKKSGETRTAVKLEVDAVTNLTPRSDSDEDERPAKKKRATEDEDEKPAKKRRAVEEEDEDEAPPKKKRRAADEDEDEAPKKKRRVVEDEDEDEEEEAPPKKKRKSEEFESV